MSEEKYTIDQINDLVRTGKIKELLSKKYALFNPETQGVFSKKKSKVPFVQVIRDNSILMRLPRNAKKLEKLGLTNTIWGYISTLKDYLEIGTNALVHYESDDHYDFEPSQELSITAISNILGISRVRASNIINDILIPCGILIEFQLNEEHLKQFGRTVTQRLLCMNPEIYCCGSKDQINPFLAKKIMANDKLEKLGVKLYWKLWHSHNSQYAELINRDVYLKRRKRIKKKKTYSKGEKLSGGKSHLKPL